jgi:hypothetical protein
LGCSLRKAVAKVALLLVRRPVQARKDDRLVVPLRAGLPHALLALEPVLDMVGAQVTNPEFGSHELFQAVVAQPETLRVVVVFHVFQPLVHQDTEKGVAVGRLPQVELVEEKPELLLGLGLVGAKAEELPFDGSGVLALALLPVQPWPAVRRTRPFFLGFLLIEGGSIGIMDMKPTPTIPILTIDTTPVFSKRYGFSWLP